jgi:hypothetical protein
MADVIVGVAFVAGFFSVGFCAGYAVRDRISRERKRRFARENGWI